MKQRRILSSSSQVPQTELSTKRHSIHQEKEAAKKQKLETTVAENEVDEKQNAECTEDEAAEMHEVDSTEDDDVFENEVDEKPQVESIKAEKEVAEKQNAESTEDEKAIAKKHEEDDAYDALLLSIEGPDWADKFYPMSDTDAEDGDELSIPSISVEDSQEDDASSEEVSSEEVSSVASALHEKEKLEADIDRAVATDKRRRKKNEGQEKQE